MTSFTPHESLLYNSRIIDTYVRLLRVQYPEVDQASLLDHAGITSWEIADQAHWFTQEQLDLFHEKAVELTGNPAIAREAGRYAASPDAIGAMRQYILGLVGPANAFSIIGQTTAKFSRSSHYESRKLSGNSVEVTVTPLPRIREKAFQCENRTGFLEAVCMMFDGSLPHIEHPECLFRGGSCCRYIIRWRTSVFVLIDQVRGYATAALVPAATVLGVLRPETIPVVFPTVFGSLLGLHWFAERGRRQELQNSLDNLLVSREMLMEQLDFNYNNAQMSNEIGRAISSPNDVELILSRVIRVLENRLDFDRGFILLKTPDNSRLQYRAGFGYDAELRDVLERAEFHLDRPGSNGVFTEVFKTQRPLLIDDFEALCDRHSPHSLEISRLLRIKSFICCPIIGEGETIGILAVDNLKSRRPLLQSDISRLMGIAPVVGVSIRNADLLAVKEKQFHSTLHVLAASIDARDPLTAGHSEKVTEYSLAICDELGLPDGEREKVRVAALLHDYGKIGVPDAVLKKPGMLTEEEHRLVREHSLKTRTILERIHFEGNFRDVPEIAGSHHEKFDGSGYPQALAGEAIPLGARIIAVADFFEAITAERHYRKPMPVPVATQLIASHAGSHFDPAIVAAFLKVLERQSPAAETGNRERVRRIRCETPVSLRKEGEAITGRTRDLSEKGLYVGMHDLLQEGIQVQLIFHLPGDHQQPVEAWGRIAWVNDPSRPAKPGFPPGCGIAFTEIHSGHEALSAFIQGGDQHAPAESVTGHSLH